jgi:hypothetical protein
LPITLNGSGAWSVKLRGENRQRVLFENTNLRLIFGPKRDEDGEWRRLQNEELHSL